MPQDPKQLINLEEELVDLAVYRLADRVAGRKPDPLIVHVAYAQDNQLYRNGRIVAVDPRTYAEAKARTPNELVNKFGLTYAPETPLLLHRRLADVLVDTAIDMRDRYGQYTVAMDGLRTVDSGRLMEQSRPDLVQAQLLAPAGTSAHNRALAVDSKLFELITPGQPYSEGVTLGLLREADEKGHLDDLDMTASSRFFAIAPSEPAYRNRLNRLRAWQRASVQNKLPIASLLSEFWDDRVPGSPSDMWRVLACRALCVGVDANPKTNMAMGLLKMNMNALHETFSRGDISGEQFARGSYGMFAVGWDQVLDEGKRRQLEQILGPGGGFPPALGDFLFHEWLHSIHDHDLMEAGFAAQSLNPIQKSTENKVFVAPASGRTLH